MTKEEKQRTIASLLWEREGYQRNIVGATQDDDDEAVAKWEERVAQVDAELRRLGASAKKPAERASKRPGRRAAESR